MEDNYAGEFGEAWKGVGALWSGWHIKELCGALGEVLCCVQVFYFAKHFENTVFTSRPVLGNQCQFFFTTF